MTRQLIQAFTEEGLLYLCTRWSNQATGLVNDEGVLPHRY